MAKYASNTKVGPQQSLAEIEKLLTRFGASQFGFMNDSDRNAAHIVFVHKKMRFRLSMELPDQYDAEYATTLNGQERVANVRIAMWEKEVRRMWRSLALMVKAKLVAVDDGVATFETEFLPYIMWEDGQTTAERLSGHVHELASLKKVPSLLPVPKEE